MAKFWYAYDGVNDPFDPSSYEKANFYFRPICIDGSEICAIYTTGSTVNSNPNSPFSSNLRQYIVEALMSEGIPQPESGKICVYLRD